MAWGRWLQRVLAAALVVLGVALLASELNLLPAEWAQPVALGGPAVVMAAGLGLVVWGWSGWRQPLAPFAIERGAAECAELVAVTGGADLEVRAFGGSGQLAVGQFPSPRGPRVVARGATARVHLEPRLTTPYANNQWSVALAKTVPWAFDLRSGGGHFDLNLRDLSVASLRVHSAYGSVDLTLPAQCPAELRVRLALGDLAVCVPEGVEVKLWLIVGPLVGVDVDERRFINVAPNEWMTPLYTTTHQRCTLLVDMSAGDLRVG